MEFVLAFLALLVACAMGCRRAWLQVLAVVLGTGIGLCAYGYRKKHPVQRVHAMFNRAHSLHKAGDWEASTELLKETMRISSDAMVLEKEAKVESTAVKQMREEVKELLDKNQ